jgi:dolichol-phosphate mannosyltransferase
LPRPHVSIIIPAFNEEGRIIATLEDVVRYLADRPHTWEVVVVDDGSSDDTPALVGNWISEHRGVRMESIPHTGKGGAVRHGMLAATGEYRFLCDADLAMPIDRLAAFLGRMGAGYDIVIGSRQVAGARRFHEPATRHMMGRLFNWSVRLLAVGGFLDTQCGFKCFTEAAAEELFSLQKTEGFGFDVEILYLATKRGMRVLEMPIDWYHQEASKVRPGVDSFLMLKDTMLIRWRDLRGGYKPASGREIAGVPLERQKTVEVKNESHPVEVTDGQADPLAAAVVPTYNEAENLPELAERFFGLGIPNARLIVVDDNSPDGTAEVAEKLSERFDGRLELIRRPGKQGLGTAYVDGFSRALSQGADYVLQMDADLSHGPEYIPAFLGTLKEADVVVGSRYTVGGGVDESWSLKRRLLSYLANWGIRAVGGLKVKDVTSGFKGYRGGALRSLDLTQFRCKGFGFQAEVAHACQRLGLTVVEHPIVFADRTQGRSKMSLSIAFEALWRLLLLRWRRPPEVTIPRG